jgi:hypothetical protein
MGPLGVVLREFLGKTSWLWFASSCESDWLCVGYVGSYSLMLCNRAMAHTLLVSLTKKIPQYSTDSSLYEEIA